MVEGLLFGTYTIKEMKAPSGYQLDREIYTIKIDDSKVIFEWAAVNQATVPIEKETPEDEDLIGEIDIPEGGVPEIGTPPKNGTVEIDEDGKWTYTPDPGFTGEDEFTVIIRYPDGSEEEIIIRIDVQPVPTGPGLPKTGQHSTLLYTVLGMAIMASGLFLATRKKRNSYNE